MNKAEVIIAKADPGEQPKRVPRKCHLRGYIHVVRGC